MKILHVDIAGDGLGVDGLSRWVMEVACEQARAGHDVTVAARQPPSADVLAAAGSAGLAVIHAPRRTLHRPAAEVLARVRSGIDLVHVHGAWVPAHGLLTWWLRRKHVPYVYSSHGCLAVDIRESPGLPRKVYLAVVERPLVKGAAAHAVVSDVEADDVSAVLGRPPRHLTCITPPVDTEAIQQEPRWEHRPGASGPLVTLARYSVFHKGLDRIAAVAELLPDREFVVYGSRDPEFEDGLDDLVRSAPSNLTFASPVFGAAKTDALRDAAGYIQFSRFEGWSLALVEALAMGVPCIVARGAGSAEWLGEIGAAAVVDTDAPAIAKAIEDLLADPGRLRSLGEGGRRLASTFGPATAAGQTLELYADALG